MDFIGEAFVDDTGLGTNQTSSEQLQLQSYRTQQEVVQNLVTLAQEWEQLLYSTGGALNLQKCFWFTLSWRWSKGKAVLETQETSPASFHMTSGGQQETTLIPRIEPTTSFRTLGVYLTPTGSSKGSMITLQEGAIQYAATITGTHLSRQEALTSYVQYILPKLRYQPPLLALTKAECQKLMTILLRALLPKMHVNRNTARSIIHGPFDYGGLEIPHIYTLQGADKLQLFIGHLRIQDRTGQLIHCNLTYLQLLSGTGTFILNQSFQHYQWVERGWITSLWELANECNLTFMYPGQWLPTLP